MDASRSLSRFAWVVLATALIVLIAVCVLPHDRYLRFASVTDPEVVKARWIYERIHFDQSPIDVVFVGTSHTVIGVETQKVEDSCRKANGQHCASVNFALLNLGRNLHWLMGREALRSRKPLLLIIEVQERETRTLHPAFPFLADAQDIALAPMIINTSYFTDLARLPLRQLSLFAQTQAPSFFGLRTAFSPALYAGRHGPESPIRQVVLTREQLERQRARLDAGRLTLPQALSYVEYRASLLYLTKLLDLARDTNVQVRFLYIPTYGAPPTPEFADFFDTQFPTWHPPTEIFENAGHWMDSGHLNRAGAEALSIWVGRKIADEELIASTTGGRPNDRSPITRATSQ